MLVCYHYNMKSIKNRIYQLSAHKLASSIVLAIAGLLIAPLASLAALSVPPPKGIATVPASPLTGVSDVQNLLCGSMTWIFWGLIVLSIVMALVAGYKYVTSGGEPEKTKDAGKTLLYAAIALVVAFVAAGIPDLVASFIGVTAAPGSGGVCP